MSRLAALLEARREELMRRWCDRVARFLAPGTQAHPELMDHIPDFLDTLILNLRTSHPEPPREYDAASRVSQQGAEHGLQRLRLGFDIDAMVREYGELREVIDDLAQEAGLQPTLQEERLLSQGLSTGVAEAVAAFARGAREQDAERQTALDALENGDAFFLLDKDWRMVRVNRAQERLSRTRREDTLGRNFWEVFPAIAAPGNPYWELYHRVMHERVAEAFEAYYAPLDLWTEVTAYPGEHGGITVFFRDVTQKKRLEAALRSSEERYHLASRATQEAIWDWDLVADAVAWNEGVQTLFGYALEDIGSGGDWWLQCIHPEDRERVERNILAFIGSESSARWQDEYRFRRADGTYAHVMDRGYVARGPDGKATRMVGAMLDVSAQRSVEAELARALELERNRGHQLQALAEAAAIIHGAPSLAEMLQIITDRARTIIGAHQSVTSLTEGENWAQAINAVSLSDKYAAWRSYDAKPNGTGIYAWVCQANRPLRLTQAELVSHPGWRGFGAHRREHPPMRGWLAAPLVGRDGRNLGLIQLSDKLDGSEFTVEDEAILVQLAQLASGAVENARLASANQAAEQRVRIAVEATQLGTWDLDPRTGELVWDARTKELFGLPPDAPVDYSTFLAGIHPDDRSLADEAVQRALAPGGSGVYRLEYRTLGLQDGGVERWLDARGRAFFNESGRAMRFTGTVLDITERKRLEAERVELLERERAARAEAEKANHLKDDFLATVSHELRTPLTAILGWVQILRTGNLTEERRKRALETVDRNAHAQAQLIEDLLDISRVMSGKLTLEVETVDVGSVVESALETVRPAAVAKGIRLQPALDSLATVMGDPTRLQQIVWNLLSNAVKFTPKGGRVQVLVERRDSSVEIVVADSGQGIVPDFLPHVFERFRQAEGSVSRKFGGLGLGLSIVKHLVELHGGTIDVFSEGEGTGATFTVRLPLAVARRMDLQMPGTRALRDSEEVVCPPELAGLKLLLVDDEADTREFLRTFLEGCKAHVATASSAAEGLEVLTRMKPDLLVSDIGMPGEDGYAFIRKVRALPAAEGGRVPAVALTAYARAEDRTRALMAGFKAHVPKPVEPSELIAVLLSLAPSRET